MPKAEKTVKVEVLVDNGFYYPADVRHENGDVIEMAPADAESAIERGLVRKA